MSDLHAPGPPRYFLLRHLRAAARDPLRFYQKFWREHGDIVRVHWHGEHYLTLCVSPDAVERVLQANWSNYPKGFFYQRLSVFTGQGLFTSEGELWLKQRRLAQPAFHRARVADLAPLMSQTVAEMCERWAREKTDEPFDVAAEMMRLTLQIAGRALFGADLHGAKAERFHHLMNAAMTHVEHRFNPLSLPERVPTPRNRRFGRVKAELDDWIIEMAVRRRADEARADGTRAEDLLQLLIEARDEQTGEPMSDRQLADEVITLLVAGHETTADALAWAWALLARNPDARAQLETEAQALNGRLPEFDDLERLPYARQVFEETLRLYPPIWALARQAKNDDEIGGYPIKAGGDVVVPPFLTHRHPDFWPAPERFDPQRFAPGLAETRPKFAYYPFGGGPRLCVGQGFALMEGQIALAAIASRFRLELAPGQTLEMHPSLALRPRGGLWMTRREQGTRNRGGH